MDSIVSQANNNLESLVGQISQNEFDLTKVLNTEDATPIENTLLSSDKLIDQINQKQTKKNVFTVGSKDEPIKPVGGQKQQNSLMQNTNQSPAAYKELKQALSTQFQQEQSLSKSLSTNVQSGFSNIGSEQQLPNLANLSSKLNNVIKTSDTIDPVKLASSELSNAPISKELKQSIKEGYKNGNLLDKLNIFDYVKNIAKSTIDTLENKLRSKTKPLAQFKPTEPKDPISIDFNNGEFGIHILRKRKQKNITGNQDTVLQQIAKWIAQKINREVDCVLDLFKAHGILDTNFGIDLLARLKDISIFCDSGIAKKLGIMDELTKIAGAAADIEEILTSTKDAGSVVSESTKSSIRELYKSTRVLEQLDLLDKVVKYSASYNNTDIFDDLVNNSDDMKSLFKNISPVTRGQLMDYVKDKGSYNATTSFVDTWGKHNVYRYKDTIVKSHTNAPVFNENQFANDKDKYQIDMNGYFTPMFEEEPFKVSCIEENNFQNITPLSLNKVKEISAFGNKDIIPNEIKDSISLLSSLPIA